MTLEQFKNFAPEAGGINLLYSGTTVSAVNISSTNCLGVNIASSLAELTSVKITVNSVEYLLPVTHITPKNNYYSFSVTPTDVTAVSDLGCTSTALNPSPVSANFSKSDYDVLKNNSSTNNSVSFIFDVDRSIFSSVPVNYSSIMSGSATVAEFQELNHSSIGLSNARYEGSKTTYSSYGTIPSVALSTFEGVLYNSNITDIRIYSQSLSERNIEEIGFSSRFNNGTATQDGFPTFQKNNNPFLWSGYISGSSGSPASLTANETTIRVDWNQNELDKLELNCLYHFTTQTTEEFFIIKSLEYVESKTVETVPLDTYIMKVERGVGGSSFDHEAANLTYYNIRVKKVESDQIFEFDGNKATTVSNKKLYLPVKDLILFVGKEGMIYSGSTP